jgi:hypothetical protein
MPTINSSRNRTKETKEDKAESLKDLIEKFVNTTQNAQNFIRP